MTLGWLPAMRIPRSWWTQADAGAPQGLGCPRTPGPGAAFLQDCQPCCVEARPRPPWGPRVVSALGPGLWLRHRPSWPQPQDTCPAGPPGQSAWQRWADMPPSRHCREPFSPQCWGAAGGGPRPVRVPAVSGACSLHKALACTRPLVVLYFPVFICMYRVFVMRQRLHVVPFGLREQPRGAGELSAITSAALGCGVSVDSPVHPGVDVTYKGCVSRFCEAGVVCLWAAWWQGRPSQCLSRHTV